MGSCPNKTPIPDCRVRDTLDEFYDDLFPRVGRIVTALQNRRMGQFLTSVKKRLKQFPGRPAADFIKNDECLDFALDILPIASKTRRQEKLDAFRSIYLNTFLSDHPSYDEAIEVAALLDRWHPRHMALFRILAGTVAADRDTLGTLLPDFSREQIDRTWQDLHDDRIRQKGGGIHF